ncbi:Tn3 family transposase [Bacillus sp. FSL K6-3431]|uniref:Tn3 family transposase n=1 Tax=Bacillus sp. FSL K6-3431 TaxID=2921500 RepID=UPI0030F842A4
MEVAEWTGFEESFVHASSNQRPKGEERSIVMAALMAMGTNIGLTKMAEATPEHINFLGEYKFDSNRLPANSLRTLNKN